MIARTAQLAALVCVAGASTALAASASDNPLDYGLVAGGNVDLEKDSNFINFSIYGRGSVSGKKDSTYAGTTVVASLDADDVTGIPSGVIGEADLHPEYALQASEIIDNIESGALMPGNVTSVQVVSNLPSTLVSGTAYVVNGDVNISKNYLASDVVIAVRGEFRWAKDGGFLHDGAPGDFANAVICTGNMTLKKNASVYGAMLISGGNFTVDKDSAGVGAHIQCVGTAHIKKDAFSAMSSFRFLSFDDPARDVATVPPSTLFD